MSVLELKSELHELIVMLQTEKVLLQVLKSAQKAVEEEDLWDMLTIEQIERLKNSIESSKKPENLISHELMKQKHAKWLNRCVNIS